jgi:hypothetical protein
MSNSMIFVLMYHHKLLDLICIEWAGSGSVPAVGASSLLPRNIPGSPAIHTARKTGMPEKLPCRDGVQRGASVDVGPTDLRFLGSQWRALYESRPAVYCSPMLWLLLLRLSHDLFNDCSDVVTAVVLLRRMDERLWKMKLK